MARCCALAPHAFTLVADSFTTETDAFTTGASFVPRFLHYRGRFLYYKIRFLSDAHYNTAKTDSFNTEADSFTTASIAILQKPTPLLQEPTPLLQKPIPRQQKPMPLLHIETDSFTTAPPDSGRGVRSFLRASGTRAGSKPPRPGPSGRSHARDGVLSGPSALRAEGFPAEAQRRGGPWVNRGAARGAGL